MSLASKGSVRRFVHPFHAVAGLSWRSWPLLRPVRPACEVFRYMSVSTAPSTFLSVHVRGDSSTPLSNMNPGRALFATASEHCTCRSRSCEITLWPTPHSQRKAVSEVRVIRELGEWLTHWRAWSPSKKFSRFTLRIRETTRTRQVENPQTSDFRSVVCTGRGVLR